MLPALVGFSLLTMQLPNPPDVSYCSPKSAFQCVFNIFIMYIYIYLPVQHLPIFPRLLSLIQSVLLGSKLH